MTARAVPRLSQIGVLLFGLTSYATDPGTTAIAAVSAPPSRTASPLPTRGPFATGSARDKAVAYGKVVMLNPGYLPDHIDDATLAGLKQSDTGFGEMVQDEGGTGYRPEIGDRAYAAQLAATTMDPRAIGHLYAEADLSKQTWTYHVRIRGQADDGPPRPWKFGVDRYGDQLYEGRGIVQMPDPNVAKGLHYDLAHSPAFVFDAAMFKGYAGDEAKFREYLDEQKWRVAFVLLSTTGNDAHGSDGLMPPWVGQMREHAWTLRDRDDLMLLLESMPTFGFAMSADDKAWIVWLAASMERNARMLNGVFNPDYPAYRTDLPQNSPGSFEPYHGLPTGFLKNPLGMMTWRTGGYGDGADHDAAIQAPWQMGFYNRIVMRFARRGHTSLTPAARKLWQDLALYAARFPVMIFGAFDDPDALDARFADRYTLVIGTLDKGMFQTVRQVKDANDAGRAKLAREDRNLYAHDSTQVAGLPGSFANDLTPALYDAFMLKAPGAVEAVARFESLKQIVQGGDLAFSHTRDGYLWPVARGGGAKPASVSPPSMITFDPAKATKAADEGDRFTLGVAAAVYYGANGHFVSQTLEAGSHVADDGTFGDPVPNTVKAAFVLDASVLRRAP